MTIEAPPHRVPERTDDLVAPVLDQMRTYSHLVDTGYVYFALAVAVSAGLDGGERLWGMLVGGPSGGKTEAIRALDLVADEVAGELTAPGLLSWKGGKAGAQAVGLLARLHGRQAFAMIRDLSPLLANSDRGSGGQRDQVYAMLRDAYDGRVQRDLGNAPAPLVYEGSLTLLAAATQVVDQYAAHASALGDRWVYYRLPTPADQDARAIARAAYNADPGEQRELVQEAAARAVLEAREWLSELPSRGPMEDRIIDLAVLATRARSAVPRESGYRREIIGEAVPEGPARLTHQLRLLHDSLRALQVDMDLRLGIVQRAALDSIAPVTRRNVLEVLADGGEISLSDLARRCHTHRHAVRRAAEDLEVLGLTRGRREGADSDDQQATSFWRLDRDRAGDAARLLKPQETLPDTSPGKEGHASRTTDSETPTAAPPSPPRAAATATLEHPDDLSHGVLELAEPGPRLIDARYVPGANNPVLAYPVSAEECVKWILGDSPPMVERLPLLSLVSRIPEIGPTDARRLVQRLRINGHAQLRAIPLQPLMALARDILAITETAA